MLELIILLIFGWSFGCAAIARRKGRSMIAWFFLGMFFHAIALVVLLCLGNRRSC